MNGPYAYVGQNLIQHLQNTMKKAEVYAGKQYLEIVSNRIFMASNKKIIINPEKIKRIIHIASLIHDIGKADDHYQTQFMNTSYSKKPSFFLHEVPSAVIGDRISNGLQLDWAEGFLLSFTILNHHNAMRPLKQIRFWLDNPTIGIRRGWSFNIWHKSVIQLLNDVSFRDTSDVLKEVKLSETKSYLDRMEEIASNRNRTWPKLYSLILNPLIVGDNLDALGRDCDDPKTASRMKFIQELKEAIGIK